MKFKYKNLIVPAVMTALYGCGGGTDNDIVRIENNSAPVLDEAALNVEGLSSTYLNADGNMEWEFRFVESADEFPNPEASKSDDVDFFEIDLLTGISDADNGALLQVKDVRFVWEGPDCGSTIAVAPDYPEICNPILEELGFIDADGNIINTTFEQEEEIRELQNLPVTNDVVYGFQLKQNSLKVTPSMFAPILVTGQTSQLHIIYKVTDGETTLDRRLKVVIEGEDSAPVFIKLNDDGEPILDPETGERIAVEEARVTISEKSAPIKINIGEGIYDQDIEDIEELKMEIGDLTNTYLDQDYSIERLSIIGITAPPGTPSGVYNDSNNVSKWSEERGVTELTVEIDPSPYADQLSRGEEVELEFTYQASDGTNLVDRSFYVTVKGADDINPPEFDEPVLTQTFSTSAAVTTFDLKEGAIDLDGDSMQVIDFMPADGSTGFGIDLSNPNAVKVDPYGFLYLAPGETKTLSYTYKLTDGTLISEERTLNIEVTGSNHNLLHKSNPAINGFETGSLDDGSWSGGEGVFSVTAEAANTGDFGLNNPANGTFLTIEEDGIEQGKIEEGDDYYVNFHAKQTNSWGTARVTFNKNGDSNDSFQIVEAPNGGTTGWMEHTITYIDADEFFQDDSTFGLSYRLGVGTFDNFSLVKYDYLRSRDLVTEGQFTNGLAGGWQVSGDVTLTVTEDANRVQNTDDLQYGLEAAGGPGGGVLYLDSANLVQGGIKKGMRYILQFDLRNPTYSDPNGANPSPLLARIVDEDSGNYVRKGAFAKATATAWNTYAYHLNTLSNGTDWNGSVYASDVDFDWENANVRVEINIPANQTFQIDNIRLFPVPQ